MVRAVTDVNQPGNLIFRQDRPRNDQNATPALVDKASGDYSAPSTVAESTGRGSESRHAGGHQGQPAGLRGAGDVVLGGRRLYPRRDSPRHLSTRLGAPRSPAVAPDGYVPNHH